MDKDKHFNTVHIIVFFTNMSYLMYLEETVIKELDTADIHRDFPQHE